MIFDEPQRTELDVAGFVVVPGALDREWLARLARAFDDAPVQTSGTQHVALGEDTPELAAWRELEQHPVLAAAAAHVLGRPSRLRSLHGRNPLPGFGQQGLHADDLPRSPGEPYTVVTALWMIDAFTADNGGTRVVPGSHRLTHPPPTSLAQPLAHHPDERVVTGGAGSVLILNGHLWHSGRRNDSAAGRRAAQMVVVAE